MFVLTASGNEPLASTLVLDVHTKFVRSTSCRSFTGKREDGRYERIGFCHDIIFGQQEHI